MSGVLGRLAPDEAAGRVLAGHADDPDWLDAFLIALERRRAGNDLARVLRAWGLSQPDAGRLFGVTRQAVAKWLREGPPSARARAVADVAAATDLLAHHLRRDRIPAVVRRPAPALGGRSLLDLWAAGDTRGLLAACREMFSFGDAHR